MLEFFDPNNWSPSEHEFRIYGDDAAQTYCVVDEVDYHWAIAWRWHINKPHPNRNGTKEYFRRSLSNGKRYLPPLYLHVEIMKRTGLPPPSAAHNLVDHLDGDEWNCRRINLRWATSKENGRKKKHESLPVR